MWWPKYVDALRLGKVYLLRIFSSESGGFVKREKLNTIARVYFDSFMEQQSSKKLNELARGFVEVVAIEDEVENTVENACESGITNKVDKIERVPD